MGVIKPIRLLFISFFIWFSIYIFIPVRYIYNGGAFYPILVLILFILFFYLGFKSKKIENIKPIKAVSRTKLIQVTVILFLIGFLGVAIKIYAGFFVTEIFTSENIFKKRLESMGQEFSGGALGVIAALLYPFSFIALMITIYNFRIFHKLFILLVLIFGVYPIIETYFLGGRTIIAMLGTTLIFCVYASYYKNNRVTLFKIKAGRKTLLSLPKFLFKKTIWIPMLLIGIVFLSYSIKVVNKRLSQFNYRDTLTVWELKDYQWVKFDNDFKKEYHIAPQEEKNYMIGVYSFQHYFAHGVFEYIRLVNDLDKVTGYYYGQYEFNVFFKFFRIFKMPLKSFDELSVVVKRQAVYQTFWGPFYIDFGIFGIVIVFFWGRFIKKIYYKSTLRSTPHVIFYCYLSTIIITSFFINFIIGSSSYYLFAFLITLFLFKYWPNNLKLVAK